MFGIHVPLHLGINENWLKINPFVFVVGLIDFKPNEEIVYIFIYDSFVSWLVWKHKYQIMYCI